MTIDVFIVKYGELVDPAATVTEAGGVTPPSVLVRVTITPPAGAGPFKETLFRVVEAPPFTELGESETTVRAIGFTVSVAPFVTPL